MVQRTRSRSFLYFALLCLLWGSVLHATQAVGEEAYCPSHDSPEPIPLDVTAGQLASSFSSGPQNATATFDIVLNAGAALQANPAALAAFERAATKWEALISDPITVTIDADLASLPPGVLGSTSSVVLNAGYDVIVDPMKTDALDEPADAITASLPNATQVSFFVPGGFVVNGVRAPKANLKAQGFDLDGSFGATDATITFSTNFPFDFDNSDGVTAGQFDFETVAAHEIGHALGFTSAVDLTDTLPSGTIQLSTMDLHRFENGTVNDPATSAEFTTFPRTLVPGGEQIFDDVDHEFRLSTGRNLGDGNQASHFKDDAFTNYTVGIMDPTFDSGTVIDISAADLRVLDLLGWEIASAEADPEIELFADGVPVAGPLVYAAGTQVRLNAVATDGDGLGFPVFAWLGNTNLLSHIWNFDGATTAAPLVVFKPDPLVTFDLRPGEATSTFDLAVTVWDSLGDTSGAQLTVTATEPPDVSVLADGVPVTGPLSVTSGGTIQFQTIASDEDGLGFPVFAFLGNPSLVSYIWNFDGASAPFPLSVFTPSPPVTFTLDPGETARTFNLSVGVWDALGISTSVPITVNVTQ